MIPLYYSLTLGGILILGYGIDVKLKKEFPFQQPLTIIPITTINLILLSLMPLDINTFKLMLLVGIMIYTSYYDLATYQVKRSVHFLIIAISSFAITTTEFFTISLPGLITLPFVLLFTDNIIKIGFKKKAIGTGDILYVGALGYTFGSLIVTIGLLLGILILQGVIVLKKYQKNQKVPFIPYITLGTLLVFLIFIQIA